MASKEQPLDKTIEPVIDDADVEVQGGQLVDLELDETKSNSNVEFDYESEHSPFPEGRWPSLLSPGLYIPPG